ncbi:MAG: hypothetical protein KJS92_02100 [Bacteroidetes bacterium]|nr:hypothetical protein [Bacteroidota bacterium]
MRNFRNFLLGLLIPLPLSAQSLLTHFERDSGHTATYSEVNDFYRELAARHAKLKRYKQLGARYFSIGKSDGGLDINVFTLNASRAKAPIYRKPVLLINNAIHPGEPEGVDASMMLMRDILEHQEAWNDLLRSFTVYVIAQYNVDGVRNRSCCSRANQNGPDEYGFRGNARNLDLNRDFIKADSRNAQAFIRFFTEVEPDLFIDNHTSNGADYQYTLTYFASHPAKLDPALRLWLSQLKPKLDTSLNHAGWKVCPYVETRSEVPDSGIVGFFETGRYATGFAALHHCLGFTVETHMLKPFPQRVKANYDFMREFMKLIPDDVQFNKMGAITPASRTGHTKPGSMAHLRWKLNQEATDSILFHGYEAVRIPSEVTGHTRLAYLRNHPFSKIVPYYNNYLPVDSASVPYAYVIPQAWHEVIERLQWNGLQLRRFQEERVLGAEVSYIESWESLRSPYEGHFLHHSVKTRDTTMPVRVYPGDYWVAVTPRNAQFLFSVLSARAPDSYFSWNFFDEILQQKEGYSAYVFEDVASRLLKEDSTLAEAFSLRKSHDPLFAADPQAQLNWIYRKSAYYEPTHRLYPVYRIIGEGLKE